MKVDEGGRRLTHVDTGGGRWMKVDENIRCATCAADAVFTMNETNMNWTQSTFTYCF